MVHSTRPRRLGLAFVTLAVGLAVGTTAVVAQSPPAPATPLAVRLADDVIERWPDPTTISGKGFEYNAGIVLWGIAEVYRHTRDPRYLAYIRSWVDRFLRDDGSVDLGDDASGHNLDRIQPGNLVLLLYEETNDPKYAKAAHWLRLRFDGFPRNDAGGYWHKLKYPDEMWLDGIYMAEPFLVRYGRLFGDAAFCFETAVTQTMLVADKTRVAGGLFRHAWDSDRSAAWADPATGVSPEVWGRAMGWYVMALVDILAVLPPEHPGHAPLRDLLREAAGGLRRTQDPETGLWYQVMDKGDRPDNWLESSASAMFVYALARGVDEGLLDPSYRDIARNGWNGLVGRFVEDSEQGLVVAGAVEGMSAQKDLAGYLARQRLTNSSHGLCGVLLAASAMEWPRARPAPVPQQPVATGPPRAFRGAEGFGAFAVGGRGGDVYQVTTLADSGPGSLREGVETARGPRTVVFAISGTIYLGSELVIDRPFLTLAGQTAPGDGVTIAGFGTRIADTHDVIVRFLRFRPGDINCPNFQGDALSVTRSRDVMIDHVSASWSIDETLSVTHSDRVTVQWSIIAESLNAACHREGRHGFGSLLRWGTGGITFHHNLLAHHANRNPRLGDDLGLDFVNNVVYDWGNGPGYSGEAAEGSPRLNYVANTLVAGPSTRPDRRRLAFVGGSARTGIHQRDNRIDARVEGPPTPEPAGWELFAGSYDARPQRFDFPEVATDPAEVAFDRVLEGAGASHSRDPVDRSVVRSVAARSGSLVDSQRQAGGWPALHSEPAPPDSDRDGIPDAWELAHGLNARDRLDGAAPGAAGTTNLEAYLEARSGVAAASQQTATGRQWSDQS